MKRIFLLSFSFILAISIQAQEGKIVPSFEQVLSIKRAGNPVISPDGRHILFSLTQTDWENNRYDTEIWISQNGKKLFQLTNNPEDNRGIQNGRLMENGSLSNQTGVIKTKSTL